MSAERAAELFMRGYNCAQAVAGGYAKEAGLSEEQALAMSACFGAGIAGRRELCGALSGALMILGLVKEWNKPDSKIAAYREAKAFIEEFSAEFSSARCADLLDIAKARYGETPMARTEEYYKTRPCVLLVQYASGLLDSRLK